MSEKFDISLDLDETVGQLSQGVHRAKCVSAKVSDNKAGDGQNLILEFKSMTKGEAGRSIRTWISLKETARWRLTEVINAFAADVEKTSKGTKVRLRPGLFIGKVVRINVVHEDYMGEERASIDRILPDNAAATPARKVVEEAEDMDEEAPEEMAEEMEDEEFDEEGEDVEDDLPW